jgi:hypothetical protein
VVREVENGSVVRPGTFLKATLHAGRHFLLPTVPTVPTVLVPTKYL